MPRAIERLSAVAISKLAKRKGVFCDGGGLYLHSDPPAQCSWLFRYRVTGKTRWMGLGPYPAISLAKARELASIRVPSKRSALTQSKDEAPSVMQRALQSQKR